MTRFEMLAAVAVVAICGCSAGHGGVGSENGTGSPSKAAAPTGVPTDSSAAYYVQAGNDLAAPAVSAGIHIETPDYNANDPNAMNLIVTPGQEIFLCYYVTLPNAGEIDVGGFQSWMSPNSSHHFILYQGGTGPIASTPQPSGTISTCGFGSGTWIYATSTPGSVVGMNFPKNVGLPIPAGTQMILNMHFINPTSQTLYPKVKLNILYAKDVQQKAAVMVSFNRNINVPPATGTGPGTQTVGGTCYAPMGAQFFTMSTHTHKHATAAVVEFVHEGTAQEIVHTGETTTYPADQQAGTGTDWEHPGVGIWTAPNYLTIGAGDSFTYSCSYANTGTTAVTVGETAGTNEMCMAVGYYFPAGSSRCN